MSNLPERINVMRVVSYDVTKLIDDLREMNVGLNLDDITTDQLLDYIQDWVAEDLACGWGHTIDPRGLIYQDENGNEL